MLCGLKSSFAFHSMLARFRRFERDTSQSRDRCRSVLIAFIKGKVPFLPPDLIQGWHDKTVAVPALWRDARLDDSRREAAVHPLSIRLATGTAAAVDPPSVGRPVAMATPGAPCRRHCTGMWRGAQARVAGFAVRPSRHAAGGAPGVSWNGRSGRDLPRRAVAKLAPRATHPWEPARAGHQQRPRW